MRPRLLELLRCPKCRARFTATSFDSPAVEGEIVEGLLTCACGATYPIVDTIPRILDNAYELFPAFRRRYESQLTLPPDRSGPADARFTALMSKTQASFGYQWTTFSEMVCDFRDNFWNYLHPATPEVFAGKLGLDAGCGFGRHIYHAASCGAEMVGVDLSSAIDAAHANTRHFSNVQLVQSDIYALPFAPETFDFVYSVGVLHHLPDPTRGVHALVPLVRPGGSMFVWLYSKSRPLMNATLEACRSITTRLPHSLVKQISLAGAVVDWTFVLPYRLLRRVPGLARIVESMTPSRVKVYDRYPFQVSHADWFDRLAAPIRFYYNDDEVKALLESAGLADVQTGQTGQYGVRGRGVRQRQKPAGPSTAAAGHVAPPA